MAGMKSLNATALGWLFQTDASAHYFYVLVHCLEQKQDPRAAEVKAMMTDTERETVRAAYKRRK